MFAWSQWTIVASIRSYCGMNVRIVRSYSSGSTPRCPATRCSCATDAPVLRLAATASVLRASAARAGAREAVSAAVSSTSEAVGGRGASDCGRKDNVRSSTTLLALIGAALVAGTGMTLAAGPATPVVCGSEGCTRLPTITLQGLLTLPDALRRAEPPEAQPFVLFRVEGADGATQEVVY